MNRGSQKVRYPLYKGDDCKGGGRDEKDDC